MRADAQRGKKTLGRIKLITQPNNKQIDPLLSFIRQGSITETILS